MNRGFSQLIKIQKKSNLRLYYIELFVSNTKLSHIATVEDNISKKAWDEAGSSWKKLTEADEKTAFRILFENNVDTRLQ
jgi:hypothetical protein